jgi:uncharacterized membrane protein YqjE
MEIINRLRSITKIVLTRLELHGQLISVEWAEEKVRLKQMGLLVLLAFIFLFCALLFIGIFAVALSWESEFRNYAAGAVFLLYVLGFGICAFKLKTLAERSAATFAASRDEVEADLALLRSRL